MNCEACGEWLDEYREGALPESTRAGVAAHLAGCAACRAELEACGRLAETLKQLPRPAPGAAACLRLSEALHAAALPPRRTTFGPVLSLEDLAEYLGVEAAILEQYVGEIPCFELGGRLLFRKAKVEEWIERREMTVGFPSDRPVAADWNPPTAASKGDVSWMLSRRN